MGAPNGKPGGPSVVTVEGDVRWPAVEEAYRALLGLARRPVRTASVEGVWAAIKHLRLSKVEITVAAVARVCVQSDAKGPKAQSIRNDPDGLQKLIELAAACQATSRPGTKVARGELADRVPDPQVAAEVRVLAAERDAYKAKYEALKSCFARVEPIGALTREMTAEKVETLAELRARVDARPFDGVTFGAADGVVIAELVRALDAMGLSFDPASGELYRRSGIREVKGDIRTVLRRVMVAALAGDLPDDLPEAFRDAASPRAA